MDSPEPLNPKPLNPKPQTRFFSGCRIRSVAVQGTPEQSHKDMRNLVTSSTIWKSCQVSERLMPNIATPRDFLRLCGLEFCSFCSCQVFDLQEHASWAGDFCHHFSDPTRFDSPSSLPHSWVAMDSYLQLIH